MCYKYPPIIFSAILLLLPCISNAQTQLKERLQKHVYTLASDSLKGRKAGTSDAAKAAQYIEKQWREIGLTPISNNSYSQPFTYYNKQGNNLVAIIEGNDPYLQNEYIVVGAHYDHLGTVIENNSETVYNGADDNASGVAVITEMARILKQKQQQLKRSIIFIAFDAEEAGLVGSNAFINSNRFSIDSLKLMLSIDMVGWYKTSGYVKYQGFATLLHGSETLLKNELIPQGLHVKVQNFEKSIFTATDTEPFARKKIPTLAVTTGIKSPYHKPDDDAHLIDYNGMELITIHLVNTVTEFSTQKEKLASGEIAPKHNHQQKKIEFGITAGIGSNHHHYTAGTLNGKTATSLTAGLITQLKLKLKFLAIRPELYFESLKAMHPAGKLQTSHITLPLTLVLQTPYTNTSDGVGFDVFAGAYYSHLFNGKQTGENINFNTTYNPSETGITTGFSMRIVKLKLGFCARQALTSFTRHKNSDNAHIRNYRAYFTLSWMF